MSEAQQAITPPNSYIRQSEKTDELRAAIAKAQGMFTPLKKDRNVEVKAKSDDRRLYSFGYATLDEALETVRPHLAANGLSCVQPIVMLDNGRLALVTCVSHASGQFLESAMPLPDPAGDPQKFGGIVTYFRRYAFTAFWGLAAEEDDDANKAVGNRFTKREDRSSPRTQPPQSNEETFAFIDHHGESLVLRPKDGVPAHERFVGAAGHYIRMAGPGEHEALKRWWEEMQEPHLKELGAKYPDAEKRAREAYKQHYEKLLAAAPIPEPVA
jgi:hypothetical protein